MSVALPPLEQPGWNRLQRQALVAALVGLGLFVLIGVILSLAGNVRSSVPFFLSYLMAFSFWLSFPLGCLVLLMIYYLTGGGWGQVLRPILEAGRRTLWLLLLLAVCVWLWRK